MNKFLFLYLLLITQFFGQNIDLYLSLIDEGKTEGVLETLPELISKYPNNPGVIYIKALMTQDGKTSINIYNDIIISIYNRGALWCYVDQHVCSDAKLHTDPCPAGVLPSGSCCWSAEACATA